MVAALSDEAPPLPASAARLRATRRAPFAVAAVQGTAPNFAGISNWFNSAPLNIARPARQGGAGGFLDLWLRQLRQHAAVTSPTLYAKYKDRGLVVVGVHTPEFPFERSASNVQAALKRHGITYPVGAGQRLADLERLSQPVLAGAIHRRPERQRSCSSTTARASTSTNRPHHRAAAQTLSAERLARDDTFTGMRGTLIRAIAISSRSCVIIRSRITATDD